MDNGGNSSGIEDKGRPIRTLVVGSVSDKETWLQLGSPEGEKLAQACDVVELRVDALPASCGILEIKAGACPKPLLLTIRHQSEGGLRRMEEDARRAMAMGLLETASYLDWEAAQLGEKTRPLVDAAKAAGVRLIASCHDFQSTPPLRQLADIEKRARDEGADIVKFAFRLHSAEDLLTGIRLLQQATGPLAVMGMGALGAVSRLLYAQYGSRFIYGFLGDKPTAPGQWGAALCKAALSSLTPVHP